MQMEDGLPVHLNVYISMFKQLWWHVKKYKKYPVGFTTESIPLDVMVMHTLATDGMVVIGESLGDSIQRGRGRDGRGYMDK